VRAAGRLAGCEDVTATITLRNQGSDVTISRSVEDVIRERSSAAA
jgi:hypothetical protein